MGSKWNRLIALREERRLSQAEVAKAIGMSRSGFSMYELGEREPDLDTIRKLAEYFQVSSDYLIGLNDRPSEAGAQEIPHEWRALIEKCKAMGISPDQAIRALSGLSIISEALSSKERDREE